MRKHRTKLRSREALSLSPRLASVTGSTRPRGLSETIRGLMDLFRLSGLESLSTLLEEDREALCGPRGKWQSERRAYRHGYEEGCLVLGGRKIRVPKPRVRSLDGQELGLPHWQHFSQEDGLNTRVLEQLVVGVSTRSYPRTGLSGISGEKERKLLTALQLRGQVL